MITEPSKNILFDVFFFGRLIIDFHEDMFSRETVLFSTATKYGARNFMKKPLYPYGSLDSTRGCAVNPGEANFLELL